MQNPRVPEGYAANGLRTAIHLSSEPFTRRLLAKSPMMSGGLQLNTEHSKMSRAVADVRALEYTNPRTLRLPPMASQFERDDPQSHENPVSGERRITLRLFPPPMEFPTAIPAGERAGEIESRSAGGQDETSPQARADDTPGFALGADAEPLAEANDPQCYAARSLAVPPAVNVESRVESTQHDEPVASGRSCFEP